MSEKSIEVTVALIDQQLKMIVDEMREARAARKAQYEQNERQSETLNKIEHRLEKVEAWMTASDPTIKHVVNLQLKAQGAGAAGKVAWLIVSGVVGFIAALVAFYQKWIGN